MQICASPPRIECTSYSFHRDLLCFSFVIKSTMSRDNDLLIRQESGNALFVKRRYLNVLWYPVIGGYCRNIQLYILLKANANKVFQYFKLFEELILIYYVWINEHLRLLKVFSAVVVNNAEILQTFADVISHIFRLWKIWIKKVWSS